MSLTQNLTVRLDTGTIRKVRVLAARRGTSISQLVAEQIDALVVADDAYRTARRFALEQLEQGFALGGGTYAKRNELHER
ncbi:MAG: hypothetical protein AAB426_09740 [Myxococcota bacterium]